jgi:hypothetical protein
MAVWPAFAADGTRPLVSAFLADLWARSTSSGAGSALSSKTLPALFFCRLSRFQAALFCFRGVITAPRAHAHELQIAKAMCTSARAVDTLRHATATATRPCAQAHDNTSRRTAATATRPCAQAHDNTSCHTVATATRPCAQAHDNTSRCTAATATRPRVQAHDNTLHRTAATTTRTGATKTMKSSTKPCIHVALHGGNNFNNYGNDDDKCRQQGLVRKRTEFSYRVVQMQ